MMKSLYPLEKLKEFDDHKCVIPLLDAKSGLRGFIAIHRSHHQNPSFGATRFWPYNTEIEALQDALKLSRAMSYKAALAGLKHGGAKGVIWARKGQKKEDVLRAYLKAVNLLGGNFITGADVGINQQDLLLMKQLSPNYIVGLKADAPKFTALGLYYSIETCLKEVFGSKTMEKRTFAVQGAGKIGSELLETIYPNAKKIFVADVNLETISQIKKRFPRVVVVKPAEIYSQKVDVFSPCALAGTLNNKTIPKLKCQIIVGGANNQLADLNNGEQLKKRNILYGPDYVVNSGGLISVVDEFEQKNYDPERISSNILKIKLSLKKIVQESQKKNIPTNTAADEIAQRIIKKYSD